MCRGQQTFRYQANILKSKASGQGGRELQTLPSPPHKHKGWQAGLFDTTFASLQYSKLAQPAGAVGKGSPCTPLTINLVICNVDDEAHQRA